jgi:hypothetical protein
MRGVGVVGGVIVMGVVVAGVVVGVTCVVGGGITGEIDVFPMPTLAAFITIVEIKLLLVSESTTLTGAMLHVPATLGLAAKVRVHRVPEPAAPRGTLSGPSAPMIAHIALVILPETLSIWGAIQ